ncbi:MAG: hypothetical protein GY913_30815 [Proteobacteria bacterium]|nr:hypothetical protein [Pseudomonadota bacterium]
MLNDPGQTAAVALRAVRERNPDAIRALKDDLTQEAAWWTMVDGVSLQTVLGGTIEESAEELMRGMLKEDPVVAALIEVGALQVFLGVVRPPWFPPLVRAGADPASTAWLGVTPIENRILSSDVHGIQVVAPFGVVGPAPWVAAGVGDLEELRRRLLAKTGDRADFWKVGLGVEALPAYAGPADPAWLEDAFLAAAACGRTEVLEALECDPDTPTGGPIRALHRAVMARSPGTISVLLAKGADRDAVEPNWNSTPAGWARHAVELDPGDLLAHRCLELLTA